MGVKDKILEHLFSHLTYISYTHYIRRYRMSYNQQYHILRNAYEKMA